MIYVAGSVVETTKIKESYMQTKNFDAKLMGDELE